MLVTAFALLQQLPAAPEPDAGTAFTAGGTAKAIPERTLDVQDLLGLVPLKPVPLGAGVQVELTGVLGPGAIEVELQNTGTGYAEKFRLQLPPHPSKASPSPMLVAFHKFGSTAKDISVNTTFEQECFDRNWWLVAPLGASPKSFSSLPSQANTELVIDLVLARAKGYVDRTRIYAAGFSMGGLCATNFAARHVDPTRPMFAAIVNHTGQASTAHAYSLEDNAQVIFEFWFGGTPEDFPFEYARSSVIDAFAIEEPPMVAMSLPGGGLPGGGGPPGGGGIPTEPPVVLGVREETSLAHNLTHVPMYMVRAALEPNDHLAAQMDALRVFLERRGATISYKQVAGAFQHTWATLDEADALDWVSQFRLRLPRRATTLVDRDDRYFHFDVEQAASGAFSSFRWAIDERGAGVRVVEASNVERLSLHVADARLDVRRELLLDLGATDGALQELRLLGYGKAPASVVRDGVPSQDFVHEADTGTLVLLQSGSPRSVWTVHPSD